MKEIAGVSSRVCLSLGSLIGCEYAIACSMSVDLAGGVRVFISGVVFWIRVFADGSRIQRRDVGTLQHPAPQASSAIVLINLEVPGQSTRALQSCEHSA